MQTHWTDLSKARQLPARFKVQASLAVGQRLLSQPVIAHKSRYQAMENLP